MALSKRRYIDGYPTAPHRVRAAGSPEHVPESAAFAPAARPPAHTRCFGLMRFPHIDRWPRAVYKPFRQRCFGSEIARPSTCRLGPTFSCKRFDSSSERYALAGRSNVPAPATACRRRAFCQSCGGKLTLHHRALVLQSLERRYRESIMRSRRCTPRRRSCCLVMSRR